MYSSVWILWVDASQMVCSWHCSMVHRESRLHYVSYSYSYKRESETDAPIYVKINLLNVSLLFSALSVCKVIASWIVDEEYHHQHPNLSFYESNSIYGYKNPLGFILGGISAFFALVTWFCILGTIMEVQCREKIHDDDNETYFRISVNE